MHLPEKFHGPGELPVLTVFEVSSVYRHLIFDLIIFKTFPESVERNVAKAKDVIKNLAIVFRRFSIVEYMAA